MKKMMMKSWVILGMFVLLISFASSFAVSSRYWGGNPILANSGETVDFFVVLQNIAGEGGDVEVQGLFGDGGDIARFIGESDIYFVPFGEKVDVNISVIVPEDAIVGDIINIVVSFKIITEDSAGQFGFGSSIERKIPIKIVGAEEQVSSTFSNYIYYLVALIVLILIVIAYILIRKKK